LRRTPVPGPSISENGAEVRSVIFLTNQDLLLPPAPPGAAEFLTISIMVNDKVARFAKPDQAFETPIKRLVLPGSSRLGPHSASGPYKKAAPIRPVGLWAISGVKTITGPLQSYCPPQAGFCVPAGWLRPTIAIGCSYLFLCPWPVQMRTHVEAKLPSDIRRLWLTLRPAPGKKKEISLFFWLPPFPPPPKIFVAT